MSSDGKATKGRALGVLCVAVFAALPTLALVNGAAYGPLALSLGVVMVTALAATGRERLTLDMPLIGLGTAFLILCWLSVLWSIVPAHSRAGAWQETVVIVGALLLLAGRNGIAPATFAKVMAVLPAATLLGVAAMTFDAASSYALSDHFHRAATKYNRGVDYLCILIWPVLAYHANSRNWRSVAILGVAIALAVLVTKSTTARLEVVAGACGFAMARLPRFGTKTLARGLGALALGLPFLLQAISPENRAALAPHIKPSALHRLEIWDYMSADILQRPFLGWGVDSAEFLPIDPARVQHYVFAGHKGIYPHNQWLEAWVSLGGGGVLLVLVFALLALRRIGRFERDWRPYAMAAFMAALGLSLTSYRLSTDSWLGALAATTVLFALGRRAASSGAEGGPA